MPKVGVAELVSTVTLVAAVSVPVTVPPPFAMSLNEKWKVSAFTGHAAMEIKTADKIGTTNRST